MSQQARRTLVCILWFAVGIMLIVRGLPYTGLTSSDAATRDFTPLSGNNVWIALAVAVVLGATAVRTHDVRAARRVVDVLAAIADAARTGAPPAASGSPAAESIPATGPAERAAP